MSLNSTATGRLSPPSRIVSDDSAMRLRELRREEALEVAAREQLALNALRELAVLDRDGGDAGERDAELEVVVAEPVRRGDVVDVEHAERLAPRCR